MRTGRRRHKQQQVTDVTQLAAAVRNDFLNLWMTQVWPAAHETLSAHLLPDIITVVKGF
jgi:hypothetical protein